MKMLLRLALPILLHASDALASEGDPTSQPTGGKEQAGMLEATLKGERVSLPSLGIEVEADVIGDLATVKVIQTFTNPFATPLHATYLFPLNEGAAVYEMTMEVGDERVRAVIKEKAEAQKTFETAKAEGKAASLVTEHRPNMFTQDVANLMPGLPIRVEIKYVRPVERRDGVYRLVVPLVVGPRFVPSQTSETLPVPMSPAASPPLPRYPPVSELVNPTAVEKDRVKLRVRIDGGMPITDVDSRTHKIEARALAASRYEVNLAGGKTVDNRDFVLTYKLGGQRTTAGLLAYRDARGGFFSLMIEPPETPAADEVGAREMVFLLDCSGSMSGVPLEASKAFVRRALRGLRATDTFRVIRFGDEATEYSTTPLAATSESVEKAVAYVDALNGQGGTMMTKGIEQALGAPVVPGSLRIVTFLTDGYIGNEQEVLSVVRRHLGEARLYAFGVGTGVNRYLLEKLGKMGRGFTRYMDPTEQIEDVAGELVARLDAPVLTDITIDWGGLSPDSLTPERLPDLFAGDTVRLQGHYDRPGSYEVKITGKLGGRTATLPLKVTLPERSGSGEAVALIWARATIDELMDTLATPEPARDPLIGDDDIRQLVTELGLEFSLMTRWTSFVAVSERIYSDDPSKTKTLPVPLHPVEGVSGKAYGDQGGQLASVGAGAALAFSGSSTPEPATVGGLLVIALAGLAVGHGRRRVKTVASEGGFHVG